MIYRILTVIFLSTLMSCSASKTNDVLLVSKQPAQRWQDGLIAGNGVQGVMVMGNPHNESIVLNHEKLWVPAQNVAFDVPDMTKVVDEVRALAKEGDFGAAGTRLYSAFGEENAKMFPREEFKRLKGTQSPRFGLNYVHPGAYLNINMEENGEVKDYSRTLNLSNGKIAVSWKDDKGIWSRDCFVSRTEDALVMKISNESAAKVNCSIALNEVPGYDTAEINKPEVVVDENGIYFHTNYTNKYWLDEVEGYHILTKIDTKGGKVTIDNNQIKVEGADEVIVKTITDFLPKYSQKSRTDLSKKLNVISDYDKSLISHDKTHRELFERVDFRLTDKENQTYFTEELIENAKKNGPSPEFLECIFAVGRYAFISASGELPPTLMGIWGNTWNPNWWGHYTNDTNLNLAVSQGNTGNLPEMMEAYFSWIESLYPYWERNAERLYGARGYMGAIAHGWRHGLAIAGWHEWTGAAGWLSAYFIEHYEITNNTEFLKNRVVPLLENIALFYEDFLAGMEDEGGKYLVYPSVSPENRPSNMDGIREFKTAPNAASEIAIIRQTLISLIEAYQVLDVNQNKIADFQSILDKLPTYRINNDGAIAEWSHPDIKDEYNHRHLSHLYAVYPGVDINPATPELYDASKVAIQKRLETGQGDRSAHGFMYQGFFGARLQEPSIPWNTFNTIAKESFLFSSFITSHNPNHKTYNLDAIFSMPAILSEMCVYSRNGVLNILPGIPLDKLPKGKLNGILARKAITIHELSWDDNNKRIKMVISSTVSQSIALESRLDILDVKAERVSFDDEEWSVKLNKDEIVTVEISYLSNTLK
ncbi:MAG: glycoside hydrolase family 95 protein [Maribacter sp.]|nr:glycoside hydrolase family 95 protein [Maribacter sp.]